MAQPSAAPTGRVTPPDYRKPGFRFDSIKDGFLQVAALLDGMETNLPREEISKGSATEIKNGRVRDNWSGSRGGLVEVSAKPDSNEVIGLSVFTPHGGENWIVRVTVEGIHVTQSSSVWHAISGDSLDFDSPLDFVTFIEHMYIGSDTNRIIRLDPLAKTATELEEAPRARFVTTFAERLIAANTVAEPTKIFWSARLDATVWDPAEDISAGFESLVTGTTGPGDNITGIFGFEDQMIVLREDSIWHVTRRPSARFPFAFQPIIGNQGCDLPESAARVTTEVSETRALTRFRGGIIFADYNTRGVWFYRPGIRPQRISRQIEDELFDTIEAKEEVEAAFDPFNQEYHLKVSDEEVWVYSLRHGAWSFDDTTVSALGRFETVADVITIDDLEGTIDNLEGSIDSLSGVVLNKPGIAKGFSTGEVAIHDREETQDFGGSSFEFTWQSPNLGHTVQERSLKEVVVDALIEQVIGDAEVVIEVSRDGENWTNALTRAFATGRQKITHRNNQITGDNLYWRIRTSEATMQLHHYFAKLLEKHHHQLDS